MMSNETSTNPMFADTTTVSTQMAISISTETSTVSRYTQTPPTLRSVPKLPNVDYLKSRFGILRILEAVIGMLGLICGNSYRCSDGGLHDFYDLVFEISLIIAIIILVTKLFWIDEIFPFFYFPFLVLFRDVLFSILYIVATTLMFAPNPMYECSFRIVPRSFGAFFSACGTIVVALSAFYGYESLRSIQTGLKYKTVYERNL